MDVYEVILDLYQTHNLTKTAERLSYTPSAVSQMVSGYEKEIGIPLFRRTNRGIVPLPQAERVIQDMRQIQTARLQLHRTITDLSTLASGDFHIGAIQCVAYNWLPKMLKQFTAEYPNIDFTLTIKGYNDLASMFSRNLLDCVFTTQYAAPAASTIPILQDEYMLVLSRNHPLASRIAVPLSELDGENLILTADGLSYETGIILKQNHVSPNIRFQLDDDFAVLNMVENGFGIAVMQNLTLQRMPFDICIRPFTAHYYNTICLAYNEDSARHTAMKRFLECVQEWIRENGGAVK